MKLLLDAKIRSPCRLLPYLIFEMVNRKHLEVAELKIIHNACLIFTALYSKIFLS